MTRAGVAVVMAGAIDVRMLSFVELEIVRPVIGAVISPVAPGEEHPSRNAGEGDRGPAESDEREDVEDFAHVDTGDSGIGIQCVAFQPFSS